jgi:predicted DNA-binding protein YlxM (UPF0122 family)
MSYSSVEDLEKIIFLIDLIEQQKNKFNYEAMAVYLDIMSIVANYPFVREYIDILLGRKPTKNINSGTIETVAARMSVDIETCVKRIHKELTKIVNKNKELWTKTIGKQKPYILKENVVENSLEHEDRELENIKLDYVRKYNVPTFKYPDVIMPDDLREMIEFQKLNEQILTELKKTKKKTFQEKGELKKRIKWNKEIFQDIEILKHHYGLSCESEFAKDKGSSTKVETHVDELGKGFDEWEISKIMDISDKILTAKQQIIFNLYYLDGFTQQEIADILGSIQQDIKKDIKRIASKIKKNI